MFDWELIQGAKSPDQLSQSNERKRDQLKVVF